MAGKTRDMKPKIKSFIKSITSWTSHNKTDNHKTDTLQQYKTLPLPRELRDRIYRLLFSQRCDIRLGPLKHSPDDFEESHTAIFRVSKTTGEEALTEFYAGTTFCYRIGPGWEYKAGAWTSRGIYTELDIYPISRPDAARIKNVEILLEKELLVRQSLQMQRQACKRSINLFLGDHIVRHSFHVKLAFARGEYPETIPYEALEGLTGFRTLTIEIRAPKIPPPHNTNDRDDDVSFASDLVCVVPPPTDEETFRACERTKHQMRTVLEPALGPAIQGEGIDATEHTYSRYLEFHPYDFLAQRNATRANDNQEGEIVLKEKAKENIGSQERDGDVLACTIGSRQ